MSTDLKFDRKAVRQAQCPWRLFVLRQAGRSRRLHYTAESAPYTRRCESYQCWNCHKCRCASASFTALTMGHSQRVRGIYVDLGCGDSADAAIANECGHYGFGVDLVPPSDPAKRPHWYKNPLFMQADICERIPFDDGTVKYASCHAVIDLIEPERRPTFFAEVARVLMPSGLFAFTIAKLKHGYGFSNHQELQNARDAGLRRVARHWSFKPNTFVFSK